ncbi:MAG TPA: methyl-accepting chemotaxis protein [Thermodesulfobacteriota bacterium]|nr:methyl-accepting chemotaxis protein [Thermodesulfobacteriota bacterium]
MLKNYKLSTRITLLGIIITAGFLLTFAWLYPTVRQKVMDGKYLKTRHVVETAWGVLDFHLKKVKANQLTLEEGKKQALEAIKNLRYEKDDYFWINDMQPRMIMHPIKTEMDGKDLSGYSDPHGKKLFVTFVEKVRADGAGFVDYYWPKPGLAEPVAKISYVKGFPEWGWVIGSGIYLDDVQRELNQIFYLIFSALLVIAVGGIVFALFIARSISKPINHIAGGLNDGAAQVASASAEVSSASQSLAEGASEQAAGLEETSASIEEMTSMTKQNADNASQANALMLETREVVREANLAMEELNQSMVEITVASEETGKIIRTIDEVAFQTNLLALNAAVEAARAGEAGAGFAVVADEVRNLAIRAAEAARNTSQLIEDTVKKIKAGADIVDKTNRAFGKVAGGSKKVAELVGEIAMASQEQAQGIEQINKAVNEMDKVVQQNAASAEESASAAEEMNAQAEHMKGYVGELMAVIGGRKNGRRNETQRLPTRFSFNEGKKAKGTGIGYQGKLKLTAPKMGG